MIYLGDIPCELKKNIYSALLGGSILKISIKLIWLMLLFKFSIFFLIFCLLILCIAERGVLKYSTVTGLCLFILSVLRVFTSNILKPRVSVHVHLGLLGSLYEFSFLSLRNIPPCPWSYPWF